MYVEEEIELNEEDEDIIHYLVIKDGWRRSIH